jgi:phosphoglycolate phosphatase
MRLFFYDLDGTLVDTRADIAAAANHMLQEFGKPPASVKEISRYVGRGLHYLLQGCLKTQDESILEKGSKIYRNYYAAHMLDHSKLYPGAKETLESLKGKKQVVLTNKPDPFSKDLLAALGVSHYFTDIIPGNSVYPKKPDPAAILAIMKREKIAASETLFVGDSCVDIETARNAGVGVVVLTHGFEEEAALKAAGPDKIFKDFYGFLEYIKQHHD